MKLGALIYVEWIDACSNSGWMSEEEVCQWISKRDWIVRQVGWVLHETKTHLILCGRLETDTNHLYGQLQKIPKPWIVKRYAIRLPKGMVRK